MRKIIILCCVLVCGVIASAQTKKPAISDYTIDNCTVVFDADSVKANKTGFEFWFLKKQFSQTGLYLKMTCVDKASELHPPHRHELEEFYYIIEGEAIITLGEEEKQVGPNTCIYCPPNVYHGIRRANDTPLMYLVAHL